MTTGVAIAASAVVVANPIVAPRADVQIPSVQLSAGSADAADMLDEAFLDAIAQTPPQSSNPLAVIGELISSLAADATTLGRNAIVQAFVAGVAAVTQPELTASTAPYLDPSLGPTPEVAMSLLPGIDLQSVLPDPATVGSLPSAASAVAGALSPVVDSFVTTVINDAGYVGGEFVAAAFAVGAAVAAEPRMIGETLEALVKGDFRAALQSAIKVVTAPLEPTAMVFNAMANVVQKHLSGLPAVVGSLEGPAASLASVDFIVDQSPTVSVPVGESPRAPRPVIDTPTAPVGDDTPLPSPAAAESVSDTVAPARELQPVRDAIKSVGAQIKAQIGSPLDGVSGANTTAAEASAEASPAVAPEASTATPRGRGGKAGKAGASASDSADGGR